MKITFITLTIILGKILLSNADAKDLSPSSYSPSEDEICLDEPRLPDTLQTVLLKDMPYPGMKLTSMADFKNWRQNTKDDKITLVFYTSPTCGPCQNMKPSLTKLFETTEFKTKYKLIVVDLKNFSQTQMGQLPNMMMTPSFATFKNGQPLGALWPAWYTANTEAKMLATFKGGLYKGRKIGAISGAPVVDMAAPGMSSNKRPDFEKKALRGLQALMSCASKNFE